MKTWQDGDPITYQDLNEYEKRKAFCNGTLDYTTLTYQEFVALQEELCVPGVYYGYDDYYQSYHIISYDFDSNVQFEFYAAQTTDYLSSERLDTGTVVIS